MMNKKIGFVKAVTLLEIFLMVGGLLTCCADPAAAENTAPDITLQNDAPVYMGPVQEGDLEALTLDDFEAFGIESVIPGEQYRQYQKVLADPPPGIRIPYRMKVIDRELTLDDFFGFNVPEELSEARYEAYVSMNPVEMNGETIHYVYVYHSPLAGIGPSVENRKENIDLKKMV